jgi:hypothetical protein
MRNNKTFAKAFIALLIAQSLMACNNNPTEEKQQASNSVVYSSHDSIAKGTIRK